MNADLRKAISDATERVDRIGDMVAALHFIAAPWLMEPIDGQDRLQIKALGGVLDTLDGLMAQTEDAMENVHQVAAKVT